jgi:hypothetical protein
LLRQWSYRARHVIGTVAAGVAVAVARLDIVVGGGGVEIVLCSFGHGSDPRARRKAINL